MIYAIAIGLLVSNCCALLLAAECRNRALHRQRVWSWWFPLWRRWHLTRSVRECGPMGFVDDYAEAELIAARTWAALTPEQRALADSIRCDD